MIIQLTQAKAGLGGEEDETIFIQGDLISSFDEDEFGTWILIPPYQKPIKVRESLKQLKKLIGSMF